MKRNRKSNNFLLNIKILCFFLCAIILFSNFPLGSFAEDIEKAKETTQEAPIIIGEADSADESFDLAEIKKQGKGEKSIEELNNMSLKITDLPEGISFDEAVQKGHVYRIREQEDSMNSIVFQNKNGGKTVYLFADPVKYRDEHGTIHDKSTAIQPISDGTNAYAMVQNSVKAYFASNIENGVTLCYNDFVIQMIPYDCDGSESTIMLDEEKNIITYSDVFSSESISLEYQTMLQGFKENIVLNQYTGQSVFRFSLLAEGLNAMQQNNSWILQTKTGKKVATFGEIVVKDSAGNKALGSLDILTLSDGFFEMIVSVSENYLQSPQTVYPVYIDPSAYIWETSYYEDGYGNSYDYDSIIDVGIYDGGAPGDSGHHYLGNSGDGRVIYKLPDFYNTTYGQYVSLSDYQIGSVKIKAYFEAGPATMISAYPMTQTWDEDAYGTNPEFFDDIYDLWYIDPSLTAINTYISNTSEGQYDIDITNLVRGWAQFNKGKTVDQAKNPRYGLIISSSASRQIRSREYTSYGMNVRVQMDYTYIAGEYFAYSLNGNYRFLRRDSATSIITSGFSNSDTLKWIFEYIGNDCYYVHSAYDPSNVLYRNGTSVSLSSLPTYPSNEYIWNISYASGGGVIIKNMASPQYVLTINGTALTMTQLPSTGTSAYEQCRWGLMGLNYYVPLTNFALSDNWIKPGTTKYFNVRPTPTNASWYSGSYFNWTISDTSKVTNSSNLLTGVSNGIVYLTGTHKITGMSRTFRIVCGDIREGEYKILNQATGKYMEVKNGSQDYDTFIHQYSYRDVDYAKWTVRMLSDGYYVLKVKHSGQYLSVNQGVIYNGNKVVQYIHYNWDITRWNIIQQTDGSYKIVPKPNSAYVIRVPSGAQTDGTDLELYNSTNGRDRWIFDNVGETHGIVSGRAYNIKAFSGNLVWNVYDAGKNNGTEITFYNFNRGYQWQRWKITYVSNGDYKIKDINSGKLLSVPYNSLSSYTNVQLWDDNNETGQLFRIRENTDGTYSFFSKCSYYTMALTSENNSITSGAHIQQCNSSGNNSQKFRLSESNKAFIIVPGLFGSVLQMGENHPYYNETTNKDVFAISMLDEMANVDASVWETLLSDFKNLLLNGLLDPIHIKSKIDEWVVNYQNQPYANSLNQIAKLFTLVFDTDGESVCDVVAKPFDAHEPNTNLDKYGANNVYETMYNQLLLYINNSSSYQNYDITIFTYDWRQSCADSAADLADFIEKQCYDSVIFVSHSMGGLVASGYMARGYSERSKVEKYVSFGTPHFGTPVAPIICLTGDISPMRPLDLQNCLIEFTAYTFVTNVLVKYYLSNFPCLYELFPTQQYIQETGGYLTYNGNLKTNYQDTKNVIAQEMDGYKSALMSAAESFHNSLYVNGNHVTAYTNRTFVYSSAHETATELSLNNIIFSIVSFEYSLPQIGDSVVPMISATAGGYVAKHVIDTHMDMIEYDLYFYNSLFD